MPTPITRRIKLISLDFLNVKRSKTAAGFPHLGQRGKTRGNGFSPSKLMFTLVLGASGLLMTEAATAQTAAQQIDEAARNYLQQLMNTQAKTNGWQMDKISFPHQSGTHDLYFT